VEARTPFHASLIVPDSYTAFSSNNAPDTMICQYLYQILYDFQNYHNEYDYLLEHHAKFSSAFPLLSYRLFPLQLQLLPVHHLITLLLLWPIFQQPILQPSLPTPEILLS